MNDGLANRPAEGSDPEKIASGIALESEDTSPQILRKHNFRRFEQSFLALAFREQLNSVENFGFISSDREFVARTIIRRNPGSFGSRLVLTPGARPRKGANRRRIVSARLPVAGGDAVKAERKISL